MAYDNLQTLVRGKNWSDLEQQWLTAIGEPSADRSQLLPVIDGVVKAGQEKLAETMGWAWLSTIKESNSAADALQFARDLLVRLQDGEELREEILKLYVQAHQDHPQLNDWIERSGLKSGKSVRRALRYLDIGLKLHKGTFLLHRSDDIAAELLEIDDDAQEAEIRTSRGKRQMPVPKLIEDYDVADSNDFHVLEQLHPERIAQLVQDDPIALAAGVLRCNDNRMDRDHFKHLLVPKYLNSENWADWWGKIRNGVKKHSHLRIEGRSPMFLVYDPAGQTPEEETQIAFAAATQPREWLDLVENYLRDVKLRGGTPEATFLKQVQALLTQRIARFQSHGEPTHAFATALVSERLSSDGLPVSKDAHGKALEMLRGAKNPVAMVAAIDDARLWTLGIACVEQAFPDQWPQYFAELILAAPAGQCDALAKRVEEAGKGEYLPPVVERALANPGQFTDAVTWLWKGPEVKTKLPIPPPIELLTIILNLVGPKRVSEGKASGQTVNEMRSRIRTGLSSKNYERFRKCITSLGLPLAQALRRQINLADGLGPTVQGDLSNLLGLAYPDLHVKPKFEMWEDESVLYFTQTGYNTKKAELDELMNVKMRENAKAIGEAAARGDLSENSEYKFALEERDLLRARVAQINRELDIGKILEPADIPTEHIGIGHRAILKPIGEGKSITMTILGVGDSDITKGYYAYQTPLAGQILGKKKGEKVSLTLTGEKEIQYEIAEFEPAI